MSQNMTEHDVIVVRDRICIDTHMWPWLSGCARIEVLIWQCVGIYGDPWLWSHIHCHELRPRTGVLTCVDDSDAQGYVEVCDYGHVLNSILSWTLITNWYARITVMRRSAWSCMTLQRRTVRRIFFFMWICMMLQASVTRAFILLLYMYICIHIYVYSYI